LKFLVDAMLPPSVAERLNELGHDATTPTDHGAHNLSDDAVIEVASEEHRVIVTENASDYAAVTTCPVLFVRKSWWPTTTLSQRLAAAIDRWATSNPEPGPWSHWLAAELR